MVYIIYIYIYTYTTFQHFLCHGSFMIDHVLSLAWSFENSLGLLVLAMCYRTSEALVHELLGSQEESNFCDFHYIYLYCFIMFIKKSAKYKDHH